MKLFPDLNSSELYEEKMTDSHWHKNEVFNGNTETGLKVEEKDTNSHAEEEGTNSKWSEWKLQDEKSYAAFGITSSCYCYGVEYDAINHFRRTLDALKKSFLKRCKNDEAKKQVKLMVKNFAIEVISDLSGSFRDFEEIARNLFANAESEPGWLLDCTPKKLLDEIAEEDVEMRKSLRHCKKALVLEHLLESKLEAFGDLASRQMKALTVEELTETVKALKNPVPCIEEIERMANATLSQVASYISQSDDESANTYLSKVCLES